MKQAILNLALLTFVFLSSCKKTETLPIEDPFISKVQNYIKSQLSEAELSQLDWSKLITYDRTGKHEIVKIPLVGNIKGTDKSIYLKVVKDSFVGNYFQLRGNDVKAEIVTTSLDSKTVGVAVISNNIYDGNYKVYENGSLIKETNISLPTSVSRSVPASYVYNYQLHYLINLLNIGQPAWVDIDINNNTQLEYLDPDYVYDSNGGSNSNTELIEVELDDSHFQVGIDLEKYLKCFDEIPSTGATYDIKLYVDVPINSNPTGAINIFDGMSVGHVFIRISKSNGGLKADQVIGFYPNSGPKSLALNPITSKIVDDGVANSTHEYNASIAMNNITDSQFTVILTKLRANKNNQYDLDGFNCASFALDAINSIRPIPLTSTPMTIYVLSTLNAPLTLTLPESPQGVYKHLKDLKDNNSPGAANIEVGVMMTSLPSKGSCN